MRKIDVSGAHVICNFLGCYCYDENYLILTLHNYNRYGDECTYVRTLSSLGDGISSRGVSVILIMYMASKMWTDLASRP